MSAKKAAAKSAPKAKSAATNGAIAAPKSIAIARVLDDAKAKPKVPKELTVQRGEPTKPNGAATPEATKSEPREPKPLDPIVVELIALLRKKDGASNEEAAELLKINPKGKAPHQTPAAQVRGMIRDKVRKLHDVTKEGIAGRGTVFRIAK